METEHTVLPKQAFTNGPSSVLKPQRRSKKKYPQKKEARVSWADLPERAIEIISGRLYLYDSLNFRGVCQAWRAAARQCSFDPQLVVSYQSKSNSPYIISVMEGKGLPLNLHEFDYRHCVGSSFGWLIMRKNETITEISLLNVFTRSKFRLPALKLDVKFEHVFLTAPPSSAHFTVLVIGKSMQGYACYGLRDRSWNFRRFSRPLCQCRDYHLQQAIVLTGKIYALTLCGILVTIVDESCPGTVTSGVPLPLNWPSTPARYQQFLLEAEGEILVVRLWICVEKGRVFNVEVFCMDFLSCSWITMECLAQCVVFVGNNCSFSVSTKVTGSRGGYIFFLDGSYNAWSVFDMETRRVILEPDKGGRWLCTDQNNRIWVLPTFS